MTGIRHETVGTDTTAYIEALTKNISIAKDTEFLFNLIPKIISYPHLCLFIIAALTYIPLFFVIRKETDYAMIAVLMYMVSSVKFFPESFNIIRQSLATSFILVQFVDWGHGKKLRGTIWGLIAIFLHNSSIITFPFLLLRKIQFRFWFVVIGIGATFFMGLFQVLNEFIGATLGNGLNTSNEVVTAYLAYMTDGTTFNTNYILTNTLPLSIMCLLTYPTSKKSRPIDMFYFNIMFVTTLIANIAIPATQFGFRLVFSLYIVQILVMANAFRYKNKMGRELLGIFLFFLCLLYIHYLYGLNNSDINTIIPYKTFLL